jgi:hypothetical protein
MFKTRNAGVILSRMAVAGVFLLALVLTVFLFPGISNAYNKLDIGEPQVESSLLFREARITFSGTVDEGSDVVVKIVGSGKRVILGKNGLLPSNYVIVDNLPSLYRVMGSGSLSGIKSETMGDFNSLKSKAVAYSWSEERKLALTGTEREKQVQKAISLNEQKGAYRFSDNAIQIRDGKFKGSLHIGRQEYSPQVEVRIMVLKDSAVVAERTETLSLKGTLAGGPLDIQKEPLLFAGIFFCLTVITAVGAEEILSRGKTAYR